MEDFVRWLVDFVEHFGYAGVFIMTFLESTFVPIPAELTMVPAGYLVAKAQMNGPIVLITAVVGSLAGSLANYYIAYHYGRRFLYAYGKYLFFNHEKMERLDKFFASHGEISTLTGRLVPGLRHFISFPAGLGHMDIRKFSIYTSVGSGLWMTTLVLLGYVIGGNEGLVKHYVHYASVIAITGVILLIFVYVWHHRKSVSNKKLSEGSDGVA